MLNRKGARLQLYLDSSILSALIAGRQIFVDPTDFFRLLRFEGTAVTSS